MVACVSLTWLCCAITAPTPSSNVPTTTTVRIIIPVPLILFAACLPPDHPTSSSVDRRIKTIKLLNPVCDVSFPLLKAVPALLFADCDPDPLGGRGHVDVVDLELTPQPLDDGVDDRRTGADRARLARALDAQRISLAGHVMGLEHERRSVGRARQRIIHERAGDELAVLGVVDSLLHQGLADALHRAAMNLAGQQHWIERHTKIVDDDVVDHLDDAGGGIDLDLGDMGAVGIG